MVKLIAATNFNLVATVMLIWSYSQDDLVLFLAIGMPTGIAAILLFVAALVLPRENSLEGKLAELDRLLRRGRITEEEYVYRRGVLIGDPNV